MRRARLRLLRVLQERTVTPLGSTRAVPVDFALICATNRNLRERVTRGEFREDLYYRINGLLVTLPPLRRRTDLAVTVEKILRAERTSGVPIRVSPEVLAAFTRHQWPGNFRQLANVLRTACAMLDDDETCIGLDHLPQDFFDDDREAESVRAVASSPVKDSARLDDLALSAVAMRQTSHQQRWCTAV
jgi:transcriptional regulator of acetoin/glycerol metabolism